jgi:CPA2 family monovalent cation:H+ antiporter-2
MWLALGAALLTIVGNVVTSLISGRKAGLSYKASINIGSTLMVRGEFSIILAELGAAAGLDSILTAFTALYVLILAIAGPIMAKETTNIYNGLNHFLKCDKEWKKKSLEVLGG